MRNLNPAEIQGLFEFSLDSMFGSLDEQTEGIYVTYRFDSSKIGYAEIERDSEKKRVSWGKFFPFEWTTEELRKQGIGTLAHVSPLIELARISLLDEKYTEKRDRYVSDEREIQLRAMGLFGRKRLTPFEEYLDKSISYALSKGFKFQNPLASP